MNMDRQLEDNSEAVSEESHWIPLSDLMTGLMVIFLLIAVSYMMQVEADAARIKNVAIAYSELKPEFQAILQDFFPRYVRILTSSKYRDAISEVRIEGHTSSDWNGVASV